MMGLYVYTFDMKHTLIYALYFLMKHAGILILNSYKNCGQKIEMSTNYILNVDSRHHPPSHCTRQEEIINVLFIREEYKQEYRYK